MATDQSGLASGIVIEGHASLTSVNRGGPRSEPFVNTSEPTYTRWIFFRVGYHGEIPAGGLRHA